MIDWPSFSEDLYHSVLDQLLATLAVHPEQRVYAAAFHHVELDQALPPLFGYQSEENLQHSSGAEDPVERSSGAWMSTSTTSAATSATRSSR